MTSLPLVGCFDTNKCWIEALVWVNIDLAMIGVVGEEDVVEEDGDEVEETDGTSTKSEFPKM